MAEGSGKQGEANAPERSEGKGSGCVCLQSLEGLQQQRLTRREPADSFTGRGAAGIIRAGY